MNIAPLILASASPRRRDLLHMLGITEFEIIPAEIDETPHKGEAPMAYVERVARAKCEAVAKLHPHRTILSADTVVALGRRILPKAEDEGAARDCLKLLSGRRHHVLTSVCVMREKLKQKTVDSLVQFAHLTPADINAYVASGEWEGKAGGYAIQGRAAAFVKRLDGSYSSVVGLPLHETVKLLSKTPGSVS